MEEDTRTETFSKDSQNTSLPRYANQSRGGNGELVGRRCENHGHHGRHAEQGGARHGAREREKRRGEVKRRPPWRLESRFQLLLLSLLFLLLLRRPPWGLESRFQLFHSAWPYPSLCWNDAEMINT